MWGSELPTVYLSVPQRGRRAGCPEDQIEGPGTCTGELRLQAAPHPVAEGRMAGEPQASLQAISGGWIADEAQEAPAACDGVQAHGAGGGHGTERRLVYGLHERRAL